MSEGAFTSLMSSADSSLIVVTTAAEGEPAGCLVGFHTQSSISAQHYSFWLSKANHTYRVGLRSALFAVHLLTTEDLAVAEHFGTRSGEDSDKFSGIDLDTAEGGVPLLSAVPNRMVVERIAMLDDGGDHVCLTTRVRSAHTAGPFAALHLSDVGHLTPGRASGQRAVRP